MQRTNWIPICKPGTTHLLCKYDPARGLIEIQDRGIKYLIDLAQYQAPVQPVDPPQPK